MFGGFPNVNIPVAHTELCYFLKSDNNVITRIVELLLLNFWLFHRPLVCSVNNVLFFNNRVKVRMDSGYVFPSEWCLD